MDENVDNEQRESLIRVMTLRDALQHQLSLQRSSSRRDSANALLPEFDFAGSPALPPFSPPNHPQLQSSVSGLSLEEMPGPSLRSDSDHGSDISWGENSTPPGSRSVDDFHLPGVYTPGLPPPMRRLVRRTKSDNVTMRRKLQTPKRDTLTLQYDKNRNRASSDQRLVLSASASLHFSNGGSPMYFDRFDTITPPNGAALSPYRYSCESLPSVSPALSSLPSVQLSVSAFSDIPDVGDDHIIHCFNIVFAYFQTIAPTERNIPSIIVDFAYLCNKCHQRSPDLHHCEIHNTYECPTCWETQCCHHRGSCSECARVCPQCQREVCRHCLPPGGKKCDRCYLSLTGYNSERSEFDNRLVFNMPDDSNQQSTNLDDSAVLPLIPNMFSEISDDPD